MRSSYDFDVSSARDLDRMSQKIRSGGTQISSVAAPRSADHHGAFERGVSEGARSPSSAPATASYRLQEEGAG
jgi:hypothetical protein